MNAWIQDLRFGVRMLGRNPGFTAVAVASLALGIGANSTIFSLISALLLRPPAAERPEELVMVYTSDFSGPVFGSSSYPDYLEFQARTDVFSGLAATSLEPLVMSSGGESERVLAELVSGNYFSVLGVQPGSGRTFLSEEDRDGASPVAILSHGFWQRRFGSDPNLVGRSVAFNGRPTTIVGIAPEGFTGFTRLLSVDVWVPVSLRSDRLHQRGARGLNLIGRLRPGVGLQQARASMDVLAGQLKEAHGPVWTDVKNRGRRITLLPEAEARLPPGLRGGIVGFMGLLMAVVGLVLGIACANVASVQLALAARRRKEIAIRLSLGAGRARIVRQLLTESTLLALGGGACGLALAFWALRLLLAFRPPVPFPILLDVSLDRNVLGFTALLSLVTGLLFGLAPALQLSRSDLVPSLKDEAGAFAGAARRSRLRSSFVVAQLGLSLLLLIGAGLFLRSLRNAHAIDPGFDPDGVALLSFDLGSSGYPEARGREFYRQLLERVRALPGVDSASLAASLPLDLFGGGRRGTFVEGYPRQPGEDMEFHFNMVAPDYFRTLRIPLVLGRVFTAEDRQGAPGVVIVNETFARRFWPNRNPLGKRLSVAGPQGALLEVIAVARDGKYNTLGESPTPFFYLPALQHYRSAMTLVARSTRDPRTLLPALRREVQALDRDLPVTGVRTLIELVGVSLFPARLAAGLLGGFGIVALGLAAIGVYGIMSFAVAQRTREIGIRIALGARRGEIVRLVVGQGMRLVALGVALGLAGALALTRFLSSFLYGLSATDTATFIGVPALLAAIALLAAYAPARRATRIDPMAALRYE